eukprot:TRINITY_DN60107_c0_g1_i1.p2 TRINITY_DN60107_c0_g1~~TRINITY_DN60107_c0_g1_i1.p2  ORF type:complete len:189 (+),score=63.86 TRINITY_DN60107_c0_g1_i1:83-649(+)
MRVRCTQAAVLLLLAASAAAEEPELLAEASEADQLGPLLLHAASLGQEEVVIELLGKGAPATERNPYGETALHLAAISQEGSAAGIVRALLAAGADPSAATDGNYEGHDRPVRRTPLMWFVGFAACDAEAVSLLIAAGADLDAVSEEGKTVLDYAVGREEACAGATAALEAAGAKHAADLEGAATKEL